MGCLLRGRWAGTARSSSNLHSTRRTKWQKPPQIKRRRQRTKQERLTARDDFAVFPVELAQGGRGHGGDAAVRRLYRAAGAQAGGPQSKSLGPQPRWSL